jgi:endonuclease/exonuclease/phosphatase family metal-dependent hydrolase
VANGHWKVRQGPIVGDLADFFLPVEIIGPGPIALLAVCIMSKEYKPKLLAALDAYDSFLRSAPAIVIGDFNISPYRSYDKSNYSQIRQRLTLDYGLVTACDEKTCLPTSFHNHKLDSPHHIDHCFVPAKPQCSVQDVWIGEFDPWIKKSDHCPIAVDLQI